MAQCGACAIPQVRILDHFAAIERRTQRGCVRVLAAQPATNAALDDRRDRVDFQRIAAFFQRQRWTTRKANARVVAGTRVLVDAILDADHALAVPEQARAPRLDPPLAFELAFAFGNDDFEPGEVRGESFVESLAQIGDAIAVHGAHPLHANALERTLDGLILVDQTLLLVLRLVLQRIGGRGNDFLRSGRRGVPVLEYHEDRVAAVEQRGLHARKQSVVPEAAVAYVCERAGIHHR